jgi:uncharacterized surface protein with fasciclin (FAS1) repeats
MIRLPQVVVCLLLFSLLFTNCRNKDWDEYYERPAWLAGPIYQQLKARGNFTLYIACLERTGYANVLGRTGQFTLFAPNDSAFKAYLAEKGYSSINDLDSLTVRDIVEYSLVNNGFAKYQLASYQDNDWGINKAYKRKTFCHDVFYSDQVYDAFEDDVMSVEIINHAQKYIPYIIQAVLTANNLSDADYNFFYPGVTYNGFNVADAKVINADIIAENGYIHEVNKVIAPLPGLDEYLSTQSDYSSFKNILDRFVTLSYDTAGTHSYTGFTGITKAVYEKVYSSAIQVDPGEEEMSSLQPNLSQIKGWTICIPNNATLNDFISNKLLKHYSSVNKIFSDNPDILADLINSHMYSYSVWPSQLPAINVSLGNILTRKVCSNGFFYGINDMTVPGFYSVFGEAYLNPSCRILTEGIKYLGLRDMLEGNTGTTKTKYTLFMATDSALAPAIRAMGYMYNPTLHQVQKYDNGNIVVAWNDANVTKLIKMHIVASDISDIEGNGYYETLSKEYVGFNNNTVFTAGNNEFVEAPATEGALAENNGTAYLLQNDKYLRIPKKGPGYYLATNPNFSAFFTYLKNSSLFNPDSSISTIYSDTYYTLLIPTNAAISGAGLPAATATDSASKSKIKKFLQYHIIPEKMIFTDGKFRGDNIFTQANMKATGVPVYATLQISGLNITDLLDNVATMLTGTSANVLAKKSVIQQIDKVLKFE